MNKRFLIATSILALGVSSAAMAEPTMGERIKQDVNQAARSVESTYKDIKNELFSNPSETNQRYSAEGMIGRDVKNSEGKTIAKVKDIVISPEGRAVMIVVTDGGTLGLGAKDVAFEYDSVVNTQAQGDILLPLSKAAIAKGAAYSPESNTQGFSAVAILDSKLEDPAGKNVADIDNITFENGHAQNVIVSFDKVLGMGGKQAAVDFNDMHLLHKDSKNITARLNNNQSAAYEDFKSKQR